MVDSADPKSRQRDRFWLVSSVLPVGHRMCGARQFPRRRRAGAGADRALAPHRLINQRPKHRSLTLGADVRTGTKHKAASAGTNRSQPIPSARGRPKSRTTHRRRRGPLPPKDPDARPTPYGSKTWFTATRLPMTCSARVTRDRVCSATRPLSSSLESAMGKPCATSETIEPEPTAERPRPTHYRPPARRASNPLTERLRVDLARGRGRYVAFVPGFAENMLR